MRNKMTMYKAKNKKGYWVEGVYYKHLEVTPYPTGDEDLAKKEKHYILSDGFSDWGMPRQMERQEVIEETVSQLVKMVNGKPIYENDIVEIKDRTGSLFREGLIEYNKNYDRFCIKTTVDSLPLESYLDKGWQVESKENLYDVD